MSGQEQKIRGMVVMDGGAKYILPLSIIRRSFQIKPKDIITEPSGSKMISIHEGIYTVIRLSDCLGFGGSEKDIAEQMMILLDKQGARICLLVDGLIGEKDVISKELPVYCDGGSYISGCAFLGDTEMCLIIDDTTLFEGIEPTEPLSDEISEDADKTDELIANIASNVIIENNYLIFELGNEDYAIDIQYVREIIKYNDEIKAVCVPESPHYVEGIINRRGEIIPIINMQKRFSFNEGRELNLCIVIKYHDFHFGLLVEQAKNTEIIEDETVSDPPNIGIGGKNQFLTKICKKDGNVILMLDLDKVLAK